MRRSILCISAAAVAAPLVVWGFASAEPSRQGPLPSVRTERVHTVQDPPPSLEAGFASDMVDLDNYLVAEQQAHVAEYVAAVQAAEAETARQQEELARKTVAPIYTAAPMSTSRSGGHSDAWWQGVAQCEQGGRNDPYFGYFSFMDGSQGGKPWADQVAAGNALLASVGSESPAWAPACVAAGYAASPSG